MTHHNDRHDTTTRSASPAGADALRGVSAFSDAAARSYNAIYLTALAIVRDREAAADITQETFLRAWLKIDTLRDAALLEPWLARIARNTAAQWLRTGQHRSRVLPLISMEEIPVEPADNTDNNPRQAAGRAEQNAQLSEAIMALPDDLRQAVLLHYAEGMTASDIARLNAEAPSTVTRRLDKAHTLLRQHLESGLAASLAATTRSLHPHSADLRRALTIITAAAAIPAATRAQLLQAIADTPPPPMINAVTSAANAASIQEAGVMKSIIAKVGAVKLLTGAAVIAAVGGGAYGVKSLLTGSANEIDQPEFTGPVNTASLRNSDEDQNYLRRNSKNLSSHNPARSNRNSTSESPKHRHKAADRIGLLRNDLISTNPLITSASGETTSTVHFDLEVVNTSGLPVAGATVTVPEFGFKTGTFFSTVALGTSDSESFLTNPDGIARVAVPSGPSMSGTQSQQFQTSRITAVATHPDYSPTRQEMDFTSITKLVLTSGNILEVLPLDGATSAPINTKVEAEFKGSFEPEQYSRPDGTVVFRKIAEDNAEFILKHTNKQGKLFVSDKQSIPLPVSNASPLPISLHPTLTVMGRLDDNIPRPVTDVDAHTHWLTPASMARQETTVPVAADGTFIINNIPKGTRLSVAALGNGYCAVTSRDNNDDAFPYQVTVNQDNQALTLPMEETTDVTLEVVGPENNPVVGANISASVSVMNMGSYPRWGGSYRAVTDEHGIARIKNIPPLKRVQFQIEHPKFRFPMRELKQPFLTDQPKRPKNFAYNLELDLSAGGEIHRAMQAESKPVDPPVTTGTSFLVPEGATLIYTFPSGDEKK